MSFLPEAALFEQVITAQRSLDAGQRHFDSLVQQFFMDYLAATIMFLSLFEDGFNY